jgi:hypothetical protein
MATQGFEDLDRLSELDRSLAGLKIDNESQANTRCTCQLVLAQAHGAACITYGITYLLNIHLHTFPDREYQTQKLVWQGYISRTVNFLISTWKSHKIFPIGVFVGFRYQTSYKFTDRDISV